MTLQFFMAMEPPRTTHQQKKVNVKNGKPIFYEDEKLKMARQKLMSHLAKYRPPKKIEGCLRLTVKWLYGTRIKKQHGRYKGTRPDTDNINKLLKDCMTDLGYWHDDAQVASEIIEKLWTAEVPGIFVKIEELG